MKTIDNAKRKWYTIYVVKKYNKKQKGDFDMGFFRKQVIKHYQKKNMKGRKVVAPKSWTCSCGRTLIGICVFCPDCGVVLDWENHNLFKKWEE